MTIKILGKATYTLEKSDLLYKVTATGETISSRAKFDFERVESIGNIPTYKFYVTIPLIFPPNKASFTYTEDLYSISKEVIIIDSDGEHKIQVESIAISMPTKPVIDPSLLPKGLFCVFSNHLLGSLFIERCEVDTISFVTNVHGPTSYKDCLDWIEQETNNAKT